MINNKVLENRRLRKKSLFNIYPYLLKDLNIERANHVWIIGTTTIPIQDSFCLLNIIMDVASRKILAWNIIPKSNNSFCVETLNDALASFSGPEIINLPKDLQFISFDFINKLSESNIKVSVSPETKCPDNVYIERFWRSLKYEEVYLRNYLNIAEARQYIDIYIENYNQYRNHSSLGDEIPNNIYIRGMSI